MKLIPCPMNGPRPENEFSGGAAIRPQPATNDPGAWADYLFLDDNLPARRWEWWCHTPSGFWFAARRDTTSDEIVETATVAAIQQKLGIAWK